MTTVSTKIAAFNVNDTFIYYGATFQVTGELQVFENRDNDGITVFGRTCKCVNNPDKKSTIAGLLNNYSWMQGTDLVTYAKIK